MTPQLHMIRQHAAELMTEMVPIKPDLSWTEKRLAIKTSLGTYLFPDSYRTKNGYRASIDGSFATAHHLAKLLGGELVQVEVQVSPVAGA